MPWGTGTTECKWCERQTTNLGTKLCSGCWELETRITAQPKLAFKIMVHLRIKKKREELEKLEREQLQTEIEQNADRQITQAQPVTRNLFQAKESSPHR